MRHLVPAAVVACGLILSIVAQLFAARLIGAVEFGRFAYITGLASAVGLAFKLGYDVAATRFLSIEGAGSPKFAALLRYISAKCALLGAFGALAFTGLTIFEGKSSTFEILWAALIAVTAGPGLVFRNGLVASGRVILAFSAETHLRNLIFIGALSGFIIAGYSITSAWAVMMLAGASAISTIALLLLVIWSLRKIKPQSLAANERKAIRAYSWTLGGNSILSALWSRADVVLVAWLVNDWKFVGAFAIATRLRALVSSIESILDPIFAPQIARVFATGGWLAIQKTVRTYTLIAGAWGVAAVVIVVTGGEPLLLLLGSEYAAAYWLVLILITAEFVKRVFGPVHIMLTMTHLERQSLYASCLSFALFLLLSVVLSEGWGDYGLVWAAAIGIVARPTLQFVFMQKARTRDLSF